MPIAPPEISVLPADLLETCLEADGERRWWAIYTMARQEKALARRLVARQIPFYLPLIGRDSLIRGRPVRSYVPLFASYVFLFGSEEERLCALSTNRISRVLPVVEQEQLVWDLRQLRLAIASGVPLTVEQRLGPGRRVRVKSGPMMGLEGVITARRNCHRLLVAVSFLQQGVSLAVDDFQVEPLD